MINMDAIRNVKAKSSISPVLLNYGTFKSERTGDNHGIEEFMQVAQSNYSLEAMVNGIYAAKSISGVQTPLVQDYAGTIAKLEEMGFFEQADKIRGVSKQAMVPKDQSFFGDINVPQIAATALISIAVGYAFSKIID